MGITHFDTTVALLSVVIGMLGTLIAAIWKARGWVDQLNTTDARLADAIDALRTTMQLQHSENQRRLVALESQGNRRQRWG